LSPSGLSFSRRLFLPRPPVVAWTLITLSLACSKMGATPAAKRVKYLTPPIFFTSPLSLTQPFSLTFVFSTDEIRDADIGTGAGLFEVIKIGDDFYSCIVDCAAPKACTVVLRGASRDVLNEVERNLRDAMGVARNVVRSPRLVPGGGSAEMAAAVALDRAAVGLAGPEAGPVRAAGTALEAIPRTLASNCGANVIRTITELRARHSEAAAAAAGAGKAPAACPAGVDGTTGKIVDARAAGVWEPLAVKEATLKTAFGCATLLLRIDDILSGLRKAGGGGRPAGPRGPVADDGGNVDSEQMLPE